MSEIESLTEEWKNLSNALEKAKTDLEEATDNVGKLEEKLVDYDGCVSELKSMEVRQASLEEEMKITATQRDEVRNLSATALVESKLTKLTDQFLFSEDAINEQINMLRS